MKFASRLPFIIMVGSPPPRGGRGLKCTQPARKSWSGGVAPPRGGAWIEIADCAGGLRKIASPPHAGGVD